MIKKFDFDMYTVECDKCGHIDEYEADDWSELMQKLSEYGWRSMKIDDDTCAYYQVSESFSHIAKSVEN